MLFVERPRGLCRFDHGNFILKIQRISMLLQRIDSEMKDAARAKDARRLTVLRALKSAVKYREIEAGAELDDAAVIAVVQQQIKQRRDALAQYTAGARPELAANEQQEITALEAFLPQQLTDAELQELVRAAVAKTGAKDAKGMGIVMKELMPAVQGKAEGKRVSDAVKKAIAGAAS
jgi:uncharacterized protein YqeY